MIIVLMGPPASGKGTVGKLLSEKIKLPIFSVGGLLRNVPKDSPYYDEINEKMEQGLLAPYEITANIIKEEILKPKYSEGYIIDGWMRNLEQKDFFDPKPDFVIFINISEETTIKRISGRRFCEKDGFTCNIYTLPPKNVGECDICGGELSQREDDREEVVQERLDIYKNETMPVIEYYRDLGLLIEVDGEPDPEAVLQELLEKLQVI